MNNLLNLLGVDTKIFSEQSTAEQSKVLLLVMGVILSPLISGIVLGVFVGLLFNSKLFGFVIGVLFGAMMFFYDRSLLEPVKNRSLYIRVSVSILMGAIFSLGVKYWIFEEQIKQSYLKEVEVYNANLYQDRVVSFEEELLREEQRLQDQISRLNTERDGQRRADKVEQLQTLRENNQHLLAQRKEEVEKLKQEANATPLGVLLYMIQTLLGTRGAGYEVFLNIVILFLSMILESWAFIGAIVLRDSDYMAEMELKKIKRDEDRIRRAELDSELRDKNREMDRVIMNGGKPISEIRKDIVLTALKREYTLISQNEHQNASDRQRLQEILTELEQLEEGVQAISQSPEDALNQSLKELNVRNNSPNSEDEIPPEFLYSK